MSELWPLPGSWCWVTMGDVSEIVGGGTPSTTDPQNFEGSIPWITPADMSRHRDKYISHGSRNISEQGLSGSGARMLPKGTVLFSSRAPIGYVAIASRPVATNQGFKSFISAAGINADYLYYWLTSAKAHAEALASGTTFLELSGAKAAQLPFPVAPMQEQTRVVDKLEELLHDLDAGVAELKTAQKKLRQYRQSLLKAAVEGTLTAQWRGEQRKRNTPTETGPQLLQRILAERRARWEAGQLAKFKEQSKAPPKDWQKKYPEPVQPDSADLPPLPNGWVWTTAGLIAESIVPNRDKPLSFTGEIPWITTPDFEQPDLHLHKSISGLGLSDDECAMYRARVVPPQGVIMTCVGRFGLSAVLGVGAVINQQLHAFIPGPGVRSEYLASVVSQR